MTNWPIAVLAIAAGALPAAAATADATCPGLLHDAGTVLVTDFDGNLSGISILRGGKRISLAYLVPLIEGDRLRVAGARLTYDVDGIEYSVSDRESPCVVVTKAASSTISDLLSFAAASLTKRFEWQVDHGVGQGDDSSTAPTLELRHLSDGTARVSAGQRRMALAWKDGTPPFAVSIAGSTSKRNVLAADNITDRQLLTRAPRQLLPGTYDVTVRDGKGREAKGQFVATTGDAEWRSAMTLTPATMNTRRREAFAAALLAYGNHGLRAYDAYLRVSAAAASPDALSPLERLIRLEVAQGDDPLGE
jgi:hypothetical protein